MKRQEAAILQLNIGLYCNQACSHCHVESSPKRFEMMDWPAAEQSVRLMQNGLGSVKTVDITGGAPELNSQFKYDICFSVCMLARDAGRPMFDCGARDAGVEAAHMKATRCPLFLDFDACA